ncbi:hypothetical protein ACMAUO_00090 [Gluconacetobacter sp. Hr-1-5]|uniref:hypothetical protein n=1 Tax=Gluconacetobacter sp. Hr-1-5 TaxID=3395370 RepID=UPI003B516061
MTEAATRPTMRFVLLDSEAQFDVQRLHRAQDRLTAERTALINQLRAFMSKHGITAHQESRKPEIAVDQSIVRCERDVQPAPNDVNPGYLAAECLHAGNDNR